MAWARVVGEKYRRSFGFFVLHYGKKKGKFRSFSPIEQKTGFSLVFRGVFGPLAGLKTALMGDKRYGWRDCSGCAQGVSVGQPGRRARMGAKERPRKPRARPRPGQNRAGGTRKTRKQSDAGMLRPSGHALPARPPWPTQPDRSPAAPPAARWRARGTARAACANACPAPWCPARGTARRRSWRSTGGCGRPGGGCRPRP